jgi:hypothetical protein
MSEGQTKHGTVKINKTRLQNIINKTRLQNITYTMMSLMTEMYVNKHIRVLLNMCVFACASACAEKLLFSCLIPSQHYSDLLSL